MSGGYQLVPEVCNGSDVGTDLTNSTGTALTGGINSAKGSYTQLVASCPIDVGLIQVGIRETNNTTRHCAVDIAIGGAGSEQVILSNLFVEGGTNGQNGTDYLFPVSIASGQRIAARAANGSAVADGPSVNLILFDGNYAAEGFAGVDDLGFVTSTTFGTLLTASATINTKGAYSQLVASTARDYAGFWVRPSTASSGVGAAQNLIDIAIGASGSEKIIVPNLQVSALATPVTPIEVGPFWLPIPAGTRLSARVASAVASSTVGLHLYGIYR